MIVSSSVNKLALVVAVLLAAGIVWIGISTHELLLSVFGIALFVVGQFVRRTDPVPSTADFRAQVDRLQVMPAPPTDPTSQQATSIPGMSPQVLAQLVAGNKIAAIKRYREEYGSGLKEAKDAVDEFERQLALAR